MTRPACTGRQPGRSHGGSAGRLFRAQSPVMTIARRRFLERSTLGLAGAALAAAASPSSAEEPPPQQTPPGMPPAFGTGPAVGPDITPTTIAEAEKLVQVQYRTAERAQAAANWRVS